MNSINSTSYIILPDTPGYIVVTQSQLDKLIAANLVKQIGTAYDGTRSSVLRSVEEPARDAYGRRVARSSTTYRCYLVD